MLSGAPPDPRSEEAETESGKQETENQIEEIAAEDATGEKNVLEQIVTEATKSTGAAAESEVEAATDNTEAPDVTDVKEQPTSGATVKPNTTEVLDEARKPEIAVRELTYAWQQSEEDVK